MRLSLVCAYLEERVHEALDSELQASGHLIVQLKAVVASGTHVLVHNAAGGGPAHSAIIMFAVEQAHMPGVGRYKNECMNALY